MKRHLIWIAIALLLCACSVNTIRGSGQLVTESREISDFDRLSLNGSGKVVLTQGDTESLTIEADQNVMQYITSEVQGGMLTLGTKSGIHIRPTRLTFRLKVKDLDGLSVSGSGDITAERFDADCLEIGVSGSGDLRIDAVAAQEVEVRISGSGDAELAGQVSGQTVTIGGSGTYRGGDLRSETASVTISGSGNATIWARESLDARLTGSGAVRYYGNPATSVSRSGSGKVRDLGGK